MSKKKCDCPETVPVLERRDFTKGILHNNKGQSCLLGQCEEAFPGNPFDDPYVDDIRVSTCGRKVISLIKEEIEKLKEHNKSVPGTTEFVYSSSHWKNGVSISGFNDSPLVPKTILARLWNRVMAKMGYTEGNPEANKLDEPLKIRKA